MAQDGKIIVLDDDPTGSQTVHGCRLLTRWDTGTLLEALSDPSPLFFILSNTRAFDAAKARSIVREICGNLKAAFLETGISSGGRASDRHGIPHIFVSRSDSTLRGHYPLETDIMQEELGPFDAHFLVPAFFEAGRFTREGTHYVKTPAGEIPAHETEFARDSVFGYRSSYLPSYVEEKTGGKIPASSVIRFTPDEVRGGCLEKLMGLSGNSCCAVDAEVQTDLDGFARDVKTAARAGKRFLFRSAASLLTSLAALPPQPVAPADMSRFVKNGEPGFILVGSHVKKTTGQLEVLLREKGVEAVEVDVDRIETDSGALFGQTMKAVLRAMESGKTPVVFTSRRERTFADAGTRLAFGEAVSVFLMRIVRSLPSKTAFIISKGGITSNDVLSTGLELSSSRVAGQILPGCTVVLTPPSHRLPGIPVVIFPGNVGDDSSLAEAFRRLSPGS